MIVTLFYSLVLKTKEDEVIEGFFPEIPELGIFCSENKSELLEEARTKQRIYCKSLKVLPKNINGRELHEKYKHSDGYFITSVPTSYDEYHDGKRDLLDDVVDEFEMLLDMKDIDMLEDYIARYYKKSACDYPEFNVLVYEYYETIKQDKDKALNACMYYEYGLFPDNALPRMKFIDWMISHGNREDAFKTLYIMKRRIVGDEPLYGFKVTDDIEEEVDKRVFALLKEDPALIEDKKNYWEEK